MAKNLEIPTALTLSGEINFLEAKTADGEDKVPGFFLNANTGKPMSVAGFFHPVVVDLAGARFDRKTTPVIQDHETKLRIGHTTDQAIIPAGGSAQVAGKNVRGPMVAAAGIVSSETETAKSYVADSKRGFPFQVSLGASIEEGFVVDEGDKVEVNGKSWKGPLIVAKKSVIRELTITVLGADNRTTAKISAKTKPSTMEETKMKFEDFVKAMSLDPETLSEDQTKKLRAHYDSHMVLQAGKKDPPPLPGKKKDPVPADDTAKKLEAKRQAEADEEDRVDGIKEIFAKFKTDGLETIDWKGREVKLTSAKKSAIKDGDSPDALELACRRASYPAPSNFKGVKVENKDVQAEALEVAILRSVAADIPLKATNQSGVEYGLETWFKPEVLEASDSKLYRGVGLHYLMDMNIQAAGMNYSGPRKSNDFIRTFLEAERDLKAAGSGFSTLAVSNILENVANKTLLAAYTAQEVIWNRITGRRNLNDFKPHSTYRLTVTGGYNQVGAGGDLKHGEFSDQKFTVQGDTYGMILALTRKDMINDDLDAFQSIPSQLGRLAALAIEFAVLELVLANAGSFFSAGNNNLNTGAGSDLTIDGLSASAQTFRDQTHDDKPILTSPDRILVGSQDEVNARELFAETNVQWLDDASSTERVISRNPHVNKYVPLVSPILNNTDILKMDKTAFTGQDSNQWYMFANPAVLAAFVIGFLNGNETPVIESTSADFNTLGMQWRSYHDWGVAQNEPKGAVKNAGA